MNYLRAILLAMFFITALTLISGCGTTTDTSSVPIHSPSTSKPRALVIDTDMAADDWMAILYLLQRPDVTVKAITVTGAGESHCGPGVQHALGLVALSSYDHIPVACGREKPLRGDHAFPNSWRGGVNGLFGLTLPQSEHAASDLPAVEILDSIIASSDEKVTLLTLGPLTNIAEALANNPSLVDNIERIYIMGGAVSVPGNVGNSGVGIENELAEWNIYIDPYAAKIVMESGAPITLVPLDATEHVPVTNRFYRRLGEDLATPAATFVFEVLSKLDERFGLGGYYFWDPLAAAILTDEHLATYDVQSLCVVDAGGPESGSIVADDECPEVRVAQSADRKRFEQLFLDTLSIPSD